MATSPEAIDLDRIKLPGFGLPLTHLPEWDRNDGTKAERFPHGIADLFASEGVTIRERRMLQFITTISDKPEWERKVFDEEIVAKWRKEAVVHSDELSDLFLSEKMFEYELREKAEVYKKSGIMAILDAEATVLKSDTAISPELRQSLIDYVKILENVPEKLKDWHPGSDQMVLDLLHPSLYPLIYGVSKVLPTGHVPLLNCNEYSGAGEQVSGGFEAEALHYARCIGWGNEESLPAWGTFQWLPSNLHFTDDGAKIRSYINNLHPEKHFELYRILEQFVDQFIPLWNEALSWFYDRIRIVVSGGGDEDYYLPDGIKYEAGPDPDAEDYEELMDELRYEDDYIEWNERHRLLRQPEPKEYQPLSPPVAAAIDLRTKFAKSGLQVIFKLANIHLTPDKPNYAGGSWHVEGALNEHICATAIYYYDEENVTESHLAFRQSIDTEAMVMKPPQNEYSSVEAYFGIEQDGPALQELGKVLTRQDRLIAFPNVLQHSVQPFQCMTTLMCEESPLSKLRAATGLIDSTKSGHRKILAMFLVDPHIEILSTANVPPQQRDWWAEEVLKVSPFSSLPRELFDKIIEKVDDFPISWESALEYRQKLMNERGAIVDSVNQLMTNDTFFFCEH